jgi:bleomycin hydrolase
MVGLSGQARLAQARSRSSAAQQAQRTRQIRRQVQEQGLRSAAVDQRFLQRHKTRYAVEVPHTAIRDQEKSGRCWAYAWTKTVESMARNKGRESGSLSASFINYHALRTLAHGAIDQARRTADHPENHTYSLDADMLGEGGYSHWANHIVKRHGIVPESKMRSNTFDSRESHILQNKLHRLVTAAYRDLWHTSDGAKKTRRKIATKYKKKVDQLLKTMIGAPPRRFTVDGKTYTPRTYRQDYLKLADSDLEFVCLSNDPTRAWNRRYRETYYGKGIPDNQTYNVSMGTIQGAVKRSLRDGVAVNVAVNVDWDNPHRVAPRDHESSQTNGVMSLAAFNYGKLAPTVKLTKHDRMEHGVSLSNHMMAITGYQPRKRGQQARWQVDNSHGSGHFRGGRLDMYDDFFRHYVEEVTVPRGMVPKSVLQKIESKPALDAVTGLPSMTAPKRGTTWKTRRKRAVVQALMREDLSFAEAAKRYKVPVKRVREWHDTAQKAMSRALRATNQ